MSETIDIRELGAKIEPLEAAASTVLHGLADEIKWQMSVLARLGVPVDRLAEISPGAVGLHGLCERIANAVERLRGDLSAMASGCADLASQLREEIDQLYEALYDNGVLQRSPRAKKKKDSAGTVSPDPQEGEHAETP